jgi:hypothetical protein
MRKTLLVLCLLAVVGFGAWRYLSPATAPKNPMERMKSASPLETVRAAKPTPPIFREAPAASLTDAKRVQMEERFTDLKEEGRRVRQTLIESDPKAAQAYNEIVRRPEYRALLDRRHAIEAAWASAPENEREGMLNEMNSLRQQGFALILGEIQRLNSQPESTTIQRVAPGTLQLTPSSGAPAPTPAAPVVFQ